MPSINIRGGAKAGGVGGAGGGGSDLFTAFKSIFDSNLAPGTVAQVRARMSGLNPGLTEALLGSANGPVGVRGAGGAGRGSAISAGGIGRIGPITVNVRIQDIGLGKLEGALNRMVEVERNVLSAIQGLGGMEAGAGPAAPRTPRRRRAPTALAITGGEAPGISPAAGGMLAASPFLLQAAGARGAMYTNRLLGAQAAASASTGLVRIPYTTGLPVAYQAPGVLQPSNRIPGNYAGWVAGGGWSWGGGGPTGWGPGSRGWGAAPPGQPPGPRLALGGPPHIIPPSRGVGLPLWGGGGGGPPTINGSLAPSPGPRTPWGDLLAGAPRIAATAAALGLGAAAAGLPYVNYRYKSGLLGTSSQYSLGSWMRGVYPGAGRPPPSWSAVGLTQQEGLGLLQGFPFVPRTGAGGLNLPSVIGAAARLPGLGRMSTGQLAGAIGQGMQFGLGGPGTINAQAANYAGFLSNAMAGAQRRGISPNLLQSTMASTAGFLAQSGGSINPNALYGLSGGFLNEMPGQQVQAANLAGQFNRGFRGAMGASLSSAPRAYLMQRLTGLATPGAGLTKILGGPDVYTALRNNPVGRRMLDAYKSAYQQFGPHNPMTTNILAQILQQAQGLNANLPNNIANALGPYAGVKSPAEKAMFGSWFLTGSSQGLAAYSAYQGRVGAGLGGPSAAAGSQNYWGNGGTSWAGIASTGYNQGMSSRYRAGLAREGYRGPGGMSSMLMGAGIQTGMDPRILGAILMQESSGGRVAGSAAYGRNNVMGVTTGTLREYMRTQGINMTQHQAIAYLQSESMQQNIVDASGILKMKGRQVLARNPNATLRDVLHAYNGGGTAGYGLQVANRVAGSLGNTAASRTSAELLNPYGGYRAGFNSVVLGGSELASGIGGAAIGGIEALSSTANNAADKIKEFGDAVWHARAVLRKAMGLSPDKPAGTSAPIHRYN